MGPGPARGGADAPFSPYVQSLIRRKAEQLCRRRGFSRSDQTDLAQELTTRLLSKEGRYDPGRGASRDTFADRVIDTEVKMILRDRRRLKRAAGFTAQSLDGGAALVSGKAVPLMEVVAEEDRHRTTGGCAKVVEATELSAALEHALAPLPAGVVAVAERLKLENVSGVARALGMSRRQVYAAMAQIKARLEEVGFGVSGK
jgi:DNA-directed RNA polymerase specialized sigma24 family protein